MKTMRIYHLTSLSPALFRRLKEAQMEAAQVWNVCVDAHGQVRMRHARWPDQHDLHILTKGRFALHSQSVQAVFRAFLGTIETTRKLRKGHAEMRMKYPWRIKRFYPVKWPAQAIHKEKGRVVLPMGRGNSSLVLPITLPENAGACTLVWNRGFELHVCMDVQEASEAPGTVLATVDLGEIHLGAVTTNTGKALIVTGRGIRTLKRQRSKQLGEIARKQVRCTKRSRRWKKLQRARNKVCRRAERRVRDLRHKATRKVIDFCIKQQVGTLFIGNPHGVRNRDSGRHHNGQCGPDRLVSFGFGYLEEMFGWKQVRLEVVESPKTHTPTEELVQDLLTIVTVFSGRLYGRGAKRVRQCVVDCLKAEAIYGTGNQNNQPPA